MPEQITQIVKARLYEPEDNRQYRIVGAVDEMGFFAYVECRYDENYEWEQEPLINQYQVWEMDSEDYLKPVDILTSEHLKEWFSGQGIEIDEEQEK